MDWAEVISNPLLQNLSVSLLGVAESGNRQQFDEMTRFAKQLVSAMRTH